MNPVVITGGTGFIGTALCAELHRRKIPYILYTRRKSHADPRALEIRHVDHYREIRGRADAVCIHLAGDSGVGTVAENPERVLNEALATAETIAHAGFGKVVFVSTGLVYGFDGDSALASEEDAPTPATAYGRIKLEAEKFFTGQNHVIARIANVYGPGMTARTVFSDILSQLDTGSAVALRNLDSVRDFVFVDDIAHALVELALADVHGIFNVSTGVGNSVRHLVDELFAAAGKASPEMIATDPRTLTTRLVLDPEKLQRALGWRAQWSLERGLSTLLENYEKV